MRALLTACALLSAGCAAHAEERAPVAVELVLALDCSASVDAEEFVLQRDGLARAFRDPSVAEAIASLRPLGAAVTVIQWGGPGEVKTVIPWTGLASSRDANAFAYMVGLIQRWHHASSTSIAGAILAGMRQLDSDPSMGGRRIIDISGDGPDNSGADLAEIRRAALSAGIMINGLAIENEAPSLSDYYRRNVIAGPGSFVETARDFDDFARAMREKLLRELRPLQS